MTTQGLSPLSMPHSWKHIGDFLELAVSQPFAGAAVIPEFQCAKVPRMSIAQYIARIHTYAKCSESCLVIAFIYINQLTKGTHNVGLTRLNIHRLLITSTVVAIKFSEDQYFDNSYYARVGGISCRELNKMERRFLLLVSYRLHVSREAFDKYLEVLEGKETVEEAKDEESSDGKEGVVHSLSQASFKTVSSTGDFGQE
eukprot:TRINITY_DN1619_c0_g2_i11.p1 TRINITY_DN1619_c0_g2~~TRINITY_DN1619_c0_g2_i11.p1  ORF type:complete len:199 (-),score=19.45 TRINITY_DN1619_c0_g2_i11:193-789(-)